MNVNYRKFAVFNCAFALFVIVWGALVRATGSGAGCGSHWPLCNGEVAPTFAKMETIIEFTHRATSGLIILSIIAMFFWARKIFPITNPCRKAAKFATFAIIGEAAFGAALVLLKLVENDASVMRAVVIGFHLLNTFILMGFLSANAWFAGVDKIKILPRRSVEWTQRLWLGVIIITLVGITGGVVALGDTLFPAASLAEGLAQDLDPTSSFLIKLRVLHPIFAISMVVYFIWFSMRMLEDFNMKHQKKAAILLKGLCIMQLIIGFANLFLLAPIFLQMIHLLMAQFIVMRFAVVWAQTKYMAVAREPVPQMTAQTV